MHSSEVNIPWLPWHLVHLLLQTLCKTCLKKIQNVVHILYLYSSILHCATNLYHCPMPRCHTHISKFWWAIPFLFFCPSGESSGWKWRVSPSDWSGCTVGAHMVVHPHTFITTYTHTHPHHSDVRHSHIEDIPHMTQGDASMCFSKAVSANLVPQLTCCLAEAPVAACSHGAQACPMLGCAHCRFCLAKRSSSKGVVCFWLCGAYTLDGSLCEELRGCHFSLKVDNMRADAARLACTKCFCERLCFHGCLGENDEEDLYCENYAKLLALGKNPGRGKLRLKMLPHAWLKTSNRVCPCFAATLLKERWFLDQAIFPCWLTNWHLLSLKRPPWEFAVGQSMPMRKG